MNDEEIEELRAEELRAIDMARMHELEKKSRIFGSQADPSVLIELQDLYRRYPQLRNSHERVVARANRELLDELTVDLLMNSVAAALRRLTELEQFLKDRPDMNRRDMLLALIAILLVVIIALAMFK